MAKPWLIERRTLLVSLVSFAAELNFGMGVVSYGKLYTAFTYIYGKVMGVCTCLIYIPSCSDTKERETYNHSLINKLILCTLDINILIWFHICLCRYISFSICLAPNLVSFLSVTKFAHNRTLSFLTWLCSDVVHLNQASKSPQMFNWFLWGPLHVLLDWINVEILWPRVRPSKWYHL